MDAHFYLFLYIYILYYIKIYRLSARSSRMAGSKGETTKGK